MPKIKMLSISRYVQAALEQAEYERDENGVIIARVPGASGFFAWLFLLASKHFLPELVTRWQIWDSLKTGKA